MFIFVKEKDIGQSLAINKNKVLYIRDFPMGPKIVFEDGTYIIVDEDYLHLVARFNSN
jgi:hypothetical protein